MVLIGIQPIGVLTAFERQALPLALSAGCTYSSLFVLDFASFALFRFTLSCSTYSL